MAQTLANNQALVELSLACNRIDISALEKLTEGVIRNESLRVLRLGLNPMTTDGAMYLLEKLKDVQSSGITELDITVRFRAIIIYTHNSISHAMCEKIKWALGVGYVAFYLGLVIYLLHCLVFALHSGKAHSYVGETNLARPWGSIRPNVGCCQTSLRSTPKGPT